MQKSSNFDPCQPWNFGKRRLKVLIQFLQNFAYTAKGGMGELIIQSSGTGATLTVNDIVNGFECLRQAYSKSSFFLVAENVLNDFQLVLEIMKI
jgi:hypothetical protein